MSNRWRSGRGKDLSQRNPTSATRSSAIQTFTQTFYAGPIMHPETAREWEGVCEGAADRILTQFEKQAAHRQAIETTALRQNHVKEILGQVFGFTIFMGALVGGIYLLAIGSSTAGLVALIGSLLTPLSLFIYGRRRSRRELENKAALINPAPQ